MAKENYKPQLILDPLSNSPSSKVFSIHANQIGLVMGSGFSRWKDRIDNSTRKVEQVACLHKIIFNSESVSFSDACGNTPDLSLLKAEIEVEDVVTSNGCVYYLSLCNNTMLINLPGSYRFVLNDPTAVGVVRIYLTVMAASDVPQPTGFFMGGL